MTWEEAERLSCRLNRFLGGADEPVCARVYYHARTWGGFWVLLELIINLAFLPLERRHVAKSFRRRCK